MADKDADPFAMAGLFYFEGLAVQITVPPPTAGQKPQDGLLDFSNPDNSAFTPSTGPVV